jgi:hypothetical protein
MDDIWPYEKPRFGLSAWNGQTGRLQGYPVARADRGRALGLESARGWRGSRARMTSENGERRDCGFGDRGVVQVYPVARAAPVTGRSGGASYWPLGRESAVRARKKAMKLENANRPETETN